MNNASSMCNRGAFGFVHRTVKERSGVEFGCESALCSPRAKVRCWCSRARSCRRRVVCPMYVSWQRLQVVS